MRRLTHIALAGMTAAAVVTTLAGCGSSSSTGSGSGGDGDKKIKAALAYDVGGRGDQSFNDASYAGLEKAKKELGIEVQDVEPTDGESDADKAQRLTELARQGYNPVVAVGFANAPAVKEASAKSPKTTFGIVDDASVKAKNVANMVFTEEQSSYLAGVAAAKTTKSKTVGFVGGVETSLIKKFDAGYSQGVKDTDPSVKVVKKYLTQPPDMGGFSKPDLGKDAANGQLDQGADVIFHAAGGAGNGVIQETADAGKWAIGADADQYKQKALAKYKDKILTSATKDAEGAVFNLIKSVQDGKPQSGVIRYDLKDGGVGLSMSNPAFKKMTDAVKAVDEAKKKIEDGSIKVSTTP
ncbi:BMP family lipoprotein [Streptomyces boninensis]|uniref:BMP family lipoprotein n=1 Tax=Streptomyces boninensis TaxID=2039455 RepID=UPI003B217535